MGEQVFARLKDAENHLLDVKRAAPPDVPVRNIAGKGAVRPVTFGALHHGDNVLMAHKKGGAEREVAARQSDEHAVTHKLKAALCHNVRVGSAHMRLQSVKACVVAPVIDGIAADGR